jgi:chromosome segregation ATPase
VSKSCQHEHHPGSCGCEEPSEQRQEPTTCSGNISVPTLEEQYVLTQIREIQEEAHRTKEAIRKLESKSEPSQTSLAELQNRLRVLRQQRADLEEQRVRAAHERMRLLGHA